MNNFISTRIRRGKNEKEKILVNVAKIVPLNVFRVGLMYYKLKIPEKKFSIGSHFQLSKIYMYMYTYIMFNLLFKTVEASNDMMLTYIYTHIHYV